jgi:hypothetical protein
MSKEVVAEAVRLEYEEKSGRLYIVFEVKSEKFKQDIKRNWTQNIEYKVIDKQLILEEEE